jgi:hypothetical protein
MSSEGFGYMYAGARSTWGVKGGKVCYEVKVAELVDAQHASSGGFPLWSELWRLKRKIDKLAILPNILHVLHLVDGHPSPVRARAELPQSSY